MYDEKRYPYDEPNDDPRRKSVRRKETSRGLLLLIVYAVVAVVTLISIIISGFLPSIYIGMIVISIIVFGIIIFLALKRRGSGFVVGAIISLIMIVAMIMGSYYLLVANSTISKISSIDKPMHLVSVYVHKDNPAQEIKNAKGYNFGILKNNERENIDDMIETIGDELGEKINVTEFADVEKLLGSLQDKKIDALIMSEIYMGMIADVEGYSWVASDLRTIMSKEYENGDYMSEIPKIEPPLALPESFIMYCSGIDTFGPVSTKSRSDVNILMVANTKTKKILLLSTPRDSFVEFSGTNGAKDKLTHAGIYGVDASMDALQRLYDINIDYYLRVNFAGFVDIINALGGIEVYSPVEFTVDPIKTYYEGMNSVNGIEALAFARERYSFAKGDAQRADNQMEVIRAIIQKTASASLLRNYSEFMESVAGSFETSMPKDSISGLIRMQLTDMSGWDIESFAVSGKGKSAETFSMPGYSLSVIDLSDESIEEAKAKIEEITKGVQ